MNHTLLFPVPHEAILASAGSGKTHRLSNRVVTLLAAGAAPESIVALTFTRKAAGEFTRRVVAKLANAAADPANAQRLAAELGLAAEADGPWDSAYFAALLAKTLRNLHRLRFSTFDSFFQILVRASLWELGVSGSFALLDERLAEADKTRVLRRIFRRDTQGSTAHRDFLTAFRDATWGQEARGTTGLMANFIGNAAALLADFPGKAAWGQPTAIFGEDVKRSRWLPPPPREAVDAALDVFTEFFRIHYAADNRLCDAVHKFAGSVAAWDPALPWERQSFFEEKLLPVALNYSTTENTTFLYYKKEIVLPPLLSGIVLIIANYVLGGILERHAKVTQGVYSLLRQYDDIYEQLVRRAGRLTFADTENILTGALADVSFRLDAQTDHWLFDEFQDTNRRQWGIVKDNLDEILSDSTGERSAFFVGDVKQALYGWRGGARGLLPDICRQYEGTLEVTPLAASWRSSPDALALVNAVFGNLRAIIEVFPEATINEWHEIWGRHESAGPARERAGWSAWFECERAAGRTSGEENVGKRLECALQIFREATPLERGLTCALLTQTNAEARDAAGFLRAAGVRVTSETDLPVCEDNPVTLALLALLASAAHPDDGYSAGVVAGFGLPFREKEERTKIRHRVLEAVAASGFEGALVQVLADLAAAGARPDDAFSRRRIEQLLAVAREFDATGERDIDEFVAFARRSKKRDSGAADTVQIMTIHKAKGMEFDLVLLPFLEGERMDSPRKESFLHSGETEPRWVLSNPGNFVCENTPVLDSHLRMRREDSAYEELCKLYVALTRAKSAVCAITTAFAEKKSSAREDDAGANFPILFAATLGMPSERLAAEGADLSVQEDGQRDGDSPPRLVWESGRRDWFVDFPLEAIRSVARDSKPAPQSAEPIQKGKTNNDGSAVACAGLGTCASSAYRPRKIRERLLPSGDAHFSIPAESLFSRGQSGAEMGREVHAYLANIAFTITDGTTLPRYLETALGSPVFRAVFAEPEPGARLWRERAFDVILDDKWVSGVFDRVAIGAETAWLWDFKTDAAATPESLLERHSGQMRRYQRALQKLTGFPLTQIHVALVHVPTGRVVEL